MQANKTQIRKLKSTQIKILYSQRSVDSDHLIIVFGIEENIINVTLTSSACYNSCSSSPISGHITVESIVGSGLVNWQTNFIEPGNLDDASAHIAVDIVEAEVGDDLSKDNHIFVSKLWMLLI